MERLLDGANELTIKDLEAFLNDEGAASPTADDEQTPPAAQPGDDADKQKTIETTRAFAHRLKEEKEKARAEAFEVIAKEEGFESYAAMKAAKEAKLLEERGLDPKEVTPVVDEIVKKRLEDDPRLKELEEFRKTKIEEWAKKELIELTTLTNGKITKMEDIPKNVIELWKTKGSLKAAYLELEGEKLIREIQTGIASGQNKGSTGHLNNPSGTPSGFTEKGKRPLTQQEKDVYKLFNPSVTDEQLSKMLK